MKPFHEWKAEIVKQDSLKHRVLLYLRPYEWYHKSYGGYCNKCKTLLSEGANNGKRQRT